VGIYVGRELPTIRLQARPGLRICQQSNIIGSACRAGSFGFTTDNTHMEIVYIIGCTSCFVWAANNETRPCSVSPAGSKTVSDGNYSWTLVQPPGTAPTFL